MNDPKYREITDDDKLEYFEPGKFEVEIATRYAETLDEFIFQTTRPYCEEITQRSISKHDLVCALTQYFKGGWIRVKDRLPPANEIVIVSINDDRGDTSYRYTDTGWYLSDGKCWIVDNEATINVEAWMPLPEPPKEET